jgi:anti-sigma factor (TIGR02949 family)
MSERIPAAAAGATAACEHAVRRLWDYLDGRLPETERERVAAHLEACAACSSHFAFERGFLDALRALRRSDDEFAGLRARVAAALRQGGGRDGSAEAADDAPA